MNHLRLLIVLPLLTYIASYSYLAYYHGKLFIFNTTIHEGGTYTLLHTIFYASHFLGHIPVLTVLAFLFVGSYLCLTNVPAHSYQKMSTYLLSAFIMLLLCASLFLSLSVFGFEDTFAFIAQQKQGVNIYEQGGSWNLHLPSTILLLFFMPVYIFILKLVFGKHIDPNTSGLLYVSIGIIIFFVFTLFVNRNNIDILLSISTNPRYLAHSVRELMTFPIIYFPIPLFFFMRKDKSNSVSNQSRQNKKLNRFIASLAIAFLIGFFYQVYISLSEGIGNLAQKPSFAKTGELGIPYLLASHYFEHFLDTIYFTLFCLFLYSVSANKKMPKIR